VSCVIWRRADATVEVVASKIRSRIVGHPLKTGPFPMNGWTTAISKLSRSGQPRNGSFRYAVVRKNEVRR
jgi:hypothetical protein